jgi:hypothetical protein
MATQVQLRRGTSAQNDAFTGATGELTYDTTNKRVRVHDGGTAGGFEIKTEDGSGNTIFADNEKAIFGTGSDLQIYFNGADGIINESVAGNLLIQGDNIYLQNSGATASYLRAVDGGAVDLRYNGSPKLATTNDGVEVTGNIFASGNYIRASNGSAAVPSIQPGIDSNTGFYRVTTDTIGVSTAGLDRMRIDIAGDISFYEDTGTTPKLFWDASAEALGIGTASPSYRLDVTGGVGISGTDTTLLTVSGVATGYVAEITNVSGAAGARDGLKVETLLSNSTTKILTAASNSTDRFVVTGDGNVGIGTSSPSQALTINDGSITSNVTHTFNLFGATGTGGSSAYVTYSFVGDPNTGMFSGTADTLKFATGGTERMRIDSTGSVAIGSTSTASADRLTLKGTTTDGTTNFIVRNSADGTLLTVANNGTVTIFNNTLIGCTGLPSSGGGGAGFETGQTNGRTIFQLGTTTTSQITVQRFYNPNGNVGEIKLSGSSTIYSTTSDHRLKENVVTDWDATTRLKQLNPVRFNFIADADTTVDGFLAHEVQSVVPEAITGTHNEVDADDNPVYQGIDQSKLVPLLVKTIQELEARIVALETA